MTQDPLVIPFDNSYQKLPARFYSRLDPSPAPAPTLIAFNQPLAREMGISGGSDTELAAIFSGNATPPGAMPIAQVYAGHQFGQYNPQLGDGRALLMGETLGRDQKRRDLQLKGSGRTPYSRGGDGRAWLGPVLREYLVSEAMHHMGIPTTRALAAVETGAPVLRETALPGAVLTRVAASHIRVGTFQFFAAQRDYDALKTLLDYTIARHSPQADGALGLLQAVIEAQAKLIAQWMSVGFIHGVMNTDNCQIAGETIDYGPCAFMDRYHPMRVYSSIDRMGRYAYGNQPNIIVWNMAQLATALVPLMPDNDAAISAFTAAVHAMPEQLEQNRRDVFAAKIGISAATTEDDALIGVKSTARLFGSDSPMWLRRFLVATVGLMALAVISALTSAPSQNPLSLIIALAGPWAIGWHMTWQLRRLDIDDPARCMVLFRANRDAGLLPVLFFATAALL